VGWVPVEKTSWEADYLIDQFGVNAVNIASLGLTTPCGMEQEELGRLGNTFIPCRIFPSESFVVTV